jgi:type IV pilus assembly protein PilP
MTKDTGRMNRARTFVCFATVALMAPGAAAQQPAPPSAATPSAATPSAATPAGAPAQPGAKPPAPLPSPAFTYNPEGRRDPFVSLIGSGIDPKFSGARPTGLPGLLINEISIKGIVKDRAGFAAMIQGSDNKTYVIKAGDRLMDGTVKSIVQDAVVFSQDVNDPLSLVKQKEIRKTLRTADGGRG